MLKHKWFVIILTVLVVMGVCWTVLGATPLKYLNASLTSFSAKIYQGIGGYIEQGEDYSYSLGLLPMMDVNGSVPHLTSYIDEQLQEVIGKFPSLNVISAQKVKETWDRLRSQGLKENELFMEMGKELAINGLIMTSMVTHEDYCTVSGLVINTQTGEYKKIELGELDRDLLDKLPNQEPETVDIPQIYTPGQTPGTTELSSSAANEDEKPNEGEGVAVADPSGSQSSSTGNMMDQDETSVEIRTTTDDDTEIDEESNPISSEITDSDYSYQLEQIQESELMDNLLLGFDLGDLDGDGQDELVYSAGSSIQVRDLTNYQLRWTLNKYYPLSNDHKLLTVDLDEDGQDEIISHGNLIELKEDQLVSSQPRFISRPVSLYGDDGIAIFNKGIVYIVNYQGLIVSKYELGEGYGKRFLFLDLDGNGNEDFITTMEGEDEGATIRYFTVDGEFKFPKDVGNKYGFAIHAQHLNENDLPEIYLRRNYFDGDNFLYSKIFVLEYQHGQLELIAESPKLDYFIVDFSSYPKDNPEMLVVGGMYLESKRQSVTEITSKLFYYQLINVR